MEFFSTALAFGKEITANEPVVTWNLFLTAILIPVSVIMLGAYLNSKMRRNDEKDAKILALTEKIHVEQLNCVIEKQKSHLEVLCQVKRRVDEIHNSLDDKVTKEDCDRLMEKR